MTARHPELSTNLFELARDLARVHVAGAQAQREIDRPYFERVQDIAHQLRVLDNDNDEETRKCRMELVNELVRLADARVNS